MMRNNIFTIMQNEQPWEKNEQIHWLEVKEQIKCYREKKQNLKLPFLYNPNSIYKAIFQSDGKKIYKPPLRNIQESLQLCFHCLILLSLAT